MRDIKIETIDDTISSNYYQPSPTFLPGVFVYRIKNKTTRRSSSKNNSGLGPTNEQTEEKDRINPPLDKLNQIKPSLSTNNNNNNNNSLDNMDNNDTNSREKNTNNKQPDMNIKDVKDVSASFNQIDSSVSINDESSHIGTSGIYGY